MLKVFAFNKMMCKYSQHKPTNKEALTMKEKEIVVSVDAGLVNMAAKFAAIKDVRYYLNGVNVRRAASGYDDGVVIEGTNGHMACCIYDPSGRATEKGAILDLPVVNRFPKAGTVEVYADGGAMVKPSYGAKGPAVCFPNAVIDGKFPDVARVFPSDFSALKKGINSRDINSSYLLKAMDYFSKLPTGGMMPGVCCYQADSEGVIMMHNLKMNVFVLIMPMREDDSISKRPMWL